MSCAGKRLPIRYPCFHKTPLYWKGKYFSAHDQVSQTCSSGSETDDTPIERGRPLRQAGRRTHDRPRPSEEPKALEHTAVCCACDSGPRNAELPEPPRQEDTGVRLTFRVEGLDCADEVAVLRREVGRVVGGEHRLAFDVLSNRMMVLESAGPVTADEITAAVRRTGMTSTLWQRPAGGVSERPQQNWQARLTALSGLSVALGLALHVWLAGGFAEAFRLFGGPDGQAMPWPEIAASWVNNRGHRGSEINHESRRQTEHRLSRPTPFFFWLKSSSQKLYTANGLLY